MEGVYEIIHAGKAVGRVQVQRRGLYWHFSGRCRLSGAVVCRIAVRCGGKEENLGVPVPMDGQFGIEKSIPAKRLGAGVPEFRLLPKHEKPGGKFVPIYPEEPFSYLARLTGAFLEHRDGQVGIVIPGSGGEG